MMATEPIIAATRIVIVFWLCVLLMPFTVPAQISITDLPDKAISSIERKYTALNNLINKQLQKTLSKAQRQEARLQKKLAQKDSTAAAKLFNNTQAQYDQLKQRLHNSSLGDGGEVSGRVRNYIPRLDSLQTATKFLEQSGVLNNTKLNEVKQLSGELQQLEGSLRSAEQIEAYLKQRKELLTAQLEKFGMTKELTNLKKEVYYYRQQIDGKTRDFSPLLPNNIDPQTN